MWSKTAIAVMLLVMKGLFGQRGASLSIMQPYAIKRSVL